MQMAPKPMDWEKVRATFRQVWGYEDFRAPQAEVIANLLARQDSMVFLATGIGKSICFQLPAILQDGLTIVVSPLISLIEDQVKDLQKRHLFAAALHSGLSAMERRQVFSNFSRLRLLYVSPETLFSKSVWEKLSDPQLEITGMMIDEAHCLVQWGNSFRPDYRRLGVARSTLMATKPTSHGHISIAAFTATADAETETELHSCLKLETPQIIKHIIYRDNLSLNVAIAWTIAGRKSQTLKFIQSCGGQSGLVYVRSRRETEDLAKWLNDQSLKDHSLKTCAYHAGLADSERREIEQKWLSGEYAFVVATSAFGLGINKPDVRWVLHYHCPLTLAEYVQEIGRAGRDQKFAKTLMLVSEPTGFLDPSDRNRLEFFGQQQQKLRHKSQALIPKLPSRGNYAEVVRLFPEANIALGLLHSIGKLIWRNPFEYEILGNSTNINLNSYLNSYSNKYSRSVLEQMPAYISSKSCRWAFLMEKFGFCAEAKLLKCGICDRCAKKL